MALKVVIQHNWPKGWDAQTAAREGSYWLHVEEGNAASGSNKKGYITVHVDEWTAKRLIEQHDLVAGSESELVSANSLIAPGGFLTRFYKAS